MTNCQLDERLLLSLLVLGLHFNYPASLHISDSRHWPALTPWPVIKVTFIHHCDESWPCSSCNSLLSCFIIAGLLQSVGGRTQGAVGLGQGARLEYGWVSAARVFKGSLCSSDWASDCVLCVCNCLSGLESSSAWSIFLRIRTELVPLIITAAACTRRARKLVLNLL